MNICVAVSLALAALAALAARPRRTRLALVPAAAAVALLAVPARAPWALLSSSPLQPGIPRSPIAYSAVGRSCTVIVFDLGDMYRLYSNGLPEAVIERIGVQPLPEIARLLGMLPALLRPEARDLLSIGLGGGTVLESIPSSIRSIEVIELEPQVLKANQKIAAERADDPLSDPRVRVHLGDARGLLQLTDKRWDAIISQPSHPWTAGASHLYTRDFFSVVRSHLKPDGVFVQWIGLNFVDEPLLRSLAAAMLEAFGHVEVFQVAAAPGMLFAASSEPFAWLEGVRQALHEHPQDYARLGFHRVEDFAAIRLLDESGARALAEGGVPNTDDHNFLAARASRLGDATLADPAARALWKKWDPLLAGTDGLDRSALIRRLMATNHAERATALAHTGEEAVEETGLGWVELGQARLGRAFRHFERALKLTPDSNDAITGLVTSRIPDLTEGNPVEGISEQDLDARLTAAIAAWRHAAREDWDAVADLDDELAQFAPGEALFQEASRLRAGWRLARKDPGAAAEAQAIAEVLLARQWTAADAVLHARAAIAAGHPRDAWGSLSQVARMARRNPVIKPHVEAALQVSDQLPEELRQGVKERLLRSIATGPRAQKSQSVED